MNRIPKSLMCIILTVAALFFLTCAYGAANRIQELYPTHSFRYYKTFSSSQIQTALSFQKSEDGSQYAITFWDEKKGAVKTDLNSVEAQIIWCLGEANAVFPAVYLQGSAPGASDTAGCAISESVAWDLFGSTDIVGLSVSIDDRTYEIRGVFRGASDIVIASAQDTDTLRNVELTGSPSNDSREIAITYVSSAGLGAPDQICYGKTWGCFFTVLCSIPVLISGLWLLWKLLKISRHFQPLLRYLVWFFTALLFAISLPYLLTFIPSWLLPLQWSDLSFWPDLVSTLNERLNETLFLIPTSRDVIAKRTTIEFALCLSACIGCLGVGIKISKN